MRACRIRHTIILDDPFPDPRALADHIPDASPEPQFADDGRLEDDWTVQDDTRPADEIEKVTRWGGGSSMLSFSCLAVGLWEWALPPWTCGCCRVAPLEGLAGVHPPTWLLP